MEPPPPAWNEDNTRTFLDYGRYFVPRRDEQIQALVELIPDRDQLFTVLDLCCGEGLLAEAILERYPQAFVLGLDGSPEMLERAGKHLAPYSSRVNLKTFDLAQSSWRCFDQPIQAVVSSLAIHHLDGMEKRQLFSDIHAMLAPSGALLIADLVWPAHPLAWVYAAQAWDDAVRLQASQVDGHLTAYHFFEESRWNTYRYYDPEDIDKPSPLFDQLTWLQQAGFTAIDVFWMHAGHAVYGGYK
jgi:tRNA (cmo5U34)-methyltransferase